MVRGPVSEPMFVERGFPPHGVAPVVRGRAEVGRPVGLDRYAGLRKGGSWLPREDQSVPRNGYLTSPTLRPGPKFLPGARTSAGPLRRDSLQLS